MDRIDRIETFFGRKPKIKLESRFQQTSVLFFLFVLFIFQIGLTASPAQTKVRAPELTGGKGWLNTEKPLSLAALKGKIVLLDFWTYGCINCIHILPDLKKLEGKYPNQLVIIGVHSAKFENEGETENIRQIILRYGIEHPVVNDVDFRIWNAYRIIAYPGLVLIDPEGFVVERWFGEGHADAIDARINQTIEDFRRKGTLREQPLKFSLEKAKVGDLPLAFPGKVLADAASNRLFISDTNHDRIVVTDLDGRLQYTIGGGRTGLSDGSFTAASFNRPQGLFLEGDQLYVADTENHAVRRVDLSRKTVETIAGNGLQAEWKTKGGAAKTSALNSPWDLIKNKNSLYIAMAGTHQIWELDLDAGTTRPFAGTGAEARLDGTLGSSSFGQPSGLALDGADLYIADSETNIIRLIDLQKETVETLAGGDLFVFGDEDGKGDDVRFQHPLGLAIHNGNVLIADTYNHKIKILDPKRQTVKTFLGSGKSGQADGAAATFYEPAGLSAAGGRLYIADTNNHAIRVADLKTKTVSTLRIEGLKPPAASAGTEIVSPNLLLIRLPAREIVAERESTIVFDLKFPAGFHLNRDAPNRFEISSGKGGKIRIENAAGKYQTLPLAVPFTAAKKGSDLLNAKLTVYYCREDNTGVCLIKTFNWEIPLKIVAGKTAASRIELKETLKAN